MYIGKLASLTGTTPKAIRHYESIGLLPEPQRKGKYRIYDDSYIEIVTQIKKSQDLGFKLSEFKELVKGANIEYGVPTRIIIEAIIAKRQQLNLEVTRIQNILQQLEKLQAEVEKSSCHIDSAP